jgi:NAD(P)-dependent dehydrogenase (short-subunit alcohol dehydrogenase family)
MASPQSTAHNRIDAIMSQFLPHTPRLLNKVAVITGSSSGLGQATALLFAQHGAKLVLVDINSSEETVKLVRNIEKYKPEDVTALQLDLSEESSHSQIISTALKIYNGLDIYFANAGVVGHLAGYNSLDAEQFNFTYKVNVLACFLSIKSAAEAMIKHNFSKNQQKNASDHSNGVIITTASVAGLNYGAGGLDYSASKAAVISMTKHLAQELRGYNIRCNTICPGLVETGMTKPLFDWARQKNSQGKIGQLNPLNRPGFSQEIANTALFLASNESSYINGAAIVVDGGLTSSMPVAVRPTPAK